MWTWQGKRCRLDVNAAQQPGRGPAQRHLAPRAQRTGGGARAPGGRRGPALRGKGPRSTDTTAFGFVLSSSDRRRGATGPAECKQDAAEHRAQVQTAPGGCTGPCAAVRVRQSPKPGETDRQGGLRRILERRASGLHRRKRAADTRPQVSEGPRERLPKLGKKKLRSCLSREANT